jgi:protein SCO1/2
LSLLLTARAIALTLLFLCSAESALAQSPAVDDVAVQEHIGAEIPRDLTFVEASGARATLGSYLKGDVPTVLVLAYARCRLLCSRLLRGLGDGLSQLPQRVGTDYRLIVVSIDAHETPREAREKQQTLLARLDAGGEPWRVPYLFGVEPSVQALAHTLGFRYAWDARSEQYAHPAVVFMLTPKARIARYLYGVEYSASELSTALADAAQGTTHAAAGVDSLGSALLRCFRFDASLRRHSLLLTLLFRGGASLLLLGLVALIVNLLARERRRRPS